MTEFLPQAKRILKFPGETLKFVLHQLEGGRWAEFAETARPTASITHYRTPNPTFEQEQLEGFDKTSDG